MSSSNKKYWKGIEELAETPEFINQRDNEFAEPLPMDVWELNEKAAEATTNRRDFLKYLGFSVTAASIAACEAPVQKAIPYLNKPEEIVPGIANYYASTFFDGNDFASVVVKTREGRPIKVDGNELCPVTRGGSHARIQASVLSLYDTGRLAQPLKDSNEATWEQIDTYVKDKLQAVAGTGKSIRILTQSHISPSFKRAMAEFMATYPSAQWIQYDAISYSGMLEANATQFGKAALPLYRFNRAEYIVGIDADFLANWISPIEHARDYALTRKLEGGAENMSRHVQIESNLTVTGSNADQRLALKPSELSLAVVALYNKITGAGLPVKSTAKDAQIDAIAKDLAKYQGKALVVCGINDPSVQMLVNAINHALGSYGNTIDFSASDFTHQGRDAQVKQLIAEMEQGQVGALIMAGVNPVYTLPNGDAFAKALTKVELTISAADRADETASLCKVVAPDHHYLESWGDFHPRTGIYTFAQPTIAPLFKTRQVIESLLTWAGKPASAQAYVQATFQSEIAPKITTAAGENAWYNALRDGVVLLSKDINQPAFNAGELAVAAAGIQANAGKLGGTFELFTYQKTGMGNGNQANNPWLQEMPDPISKVTWDNYLIMNPSDMKDMGLNVINSQEKPMNVVEVKGPNANFKVAAYPQPGLPKGTVGIAYGYGRTNAGKTANNIGVNAFRSLVWNGNVLSALSGSVEITKTAEVYSLAATQTHHTMMGRAIVKEATLGEYKKDKKAGNPDILLASNIDRLNNEDGKAKATDLSLWAEFTNNNHFWNMVIDLNSCIGCGACVISCHAENNVPVVGKDEIRRSRDMHWMRIDRYYSSDMNEEVAKEQKLGAIDMFTKMEVPSEADTLQVVFQPVMCQHCNHAPCETVCPVLATTHSLEGLNQMTYNRCIGTRYCANNCPYKVRRFNWFRYNQNEQFPFNMYEDLGKMVLNPDVTVRSRGVMEKCSMCVQRIQSGKLTAKKQGIRPKDGSIKTACQQACPTDAITFGDYNDQESKVYKAYHNERRYDLLEEIGVKPSVHYLTKIRNSETNHA